MKKLRMKTLYASATRTIQPDQVAEFDDKEAKALVDGGFALPVDQDPSTGGTRKADRVPAVPAAKKTAPQAKKNVPPDGDTGQDPAGGSTPEGGGDS